MLLNFSITLMFTCPLLSCCKISSPFKENDNVAVFQFPFHIFVSLANLWFIILRTRSCPDLCPLIRRRLLALGILIPGFIRSLPMLAVYDVVYSLPVGSASSDFLFIPHISLVVLLESFLVYWIFYRVFMRTTIYLITVRTVCSLSFILVLYYKS